MVNSGVCSVKDGENTSGLPVQVWCRFRPLQGNEQCLFTKYTFAMDGCGLTVAPIEGARPPTRLTRRHSERKSSPITSCASSPASSRGGSPTARGRGGSPTGRDRGVSMSSQSSKAFTFHRVWTPSAGNVEVGDAVSSLAVGRVMSGINYTVMAYGGTGCGKTYTMMGGKGESQKGLLPRLVDRLFVELGKLPRVTEAPRVTFSVLEVYNEKLHDLLAPTSGSDVKLRLLCAGPVATVEHLTEVVVTEASQVIHLLNLGLQQRAVSATALNDRSSRGHVVATVLVEQDRPDGPPGSRVLSRLVLADLAGSENATRAAVSGDQLRESKYINKSLCALVAVVRALSSRQGVPSHVPYRNSALTKILSPALGGNSCMLLILCVSTDDASSAQTRATLRLGVQACRLPNKPMVNEVRTALEWQAQVKRAQAEVETIRLKVKSLEEKNQQLQFRVLEEQRRLSGTETIHLGRLNTHQRRASVSREDLELMEEARWMPAQSVSGVTKEPVTGLTALASVQTQLPENTVIECVETLKSKLPPGQSEGVENKLVTDRSVLFICSPRGPPENRSLALATNEVWAREEVSEDASKESTCVPNVGESPEPLLEGGASQLESEVLLPSRVRKLSVFVPPEAVVVKDVGHDETDQGLSTVASHAVKQNFMGPVVSRALEARVEEFGTQSSSEVSVAWAETRKELSKEQRRLNEMQEELLYYQHEAARVLELERALEEAKQVVSRQPEVVPVPLKAETVVVARDAAGGLTSSEKFMWWVGLVVVLLGGCLLGGLGWFGVKGTLFKVSGGIGVVMLVVGVALWGYLGRS